MRALSLFALPLRIMRKVIRGERLFTDMKNRDAWESEYATGRWDQLVTRHKYSGNMAAIAHLLLFATKGDRIRLLDVACGNGAVAHTLFKLNLQLDYVGSDISDVALDRLRATWPGVNVVCADMADVDAIVGDFDVILFSECLYYVDYKMVLDAYRAKVGKDGVVIISMHGAGSRRFIWQAISERMVTLQTFVVSHTESDTSWTVKLLKYKDPLA